MTFDAQSRLPIPLFYSPLYVAAGHGFDTTRKARWLHDSLLDAPIAGFEWRTPPPLDAARLARVHDRAYVDAVRLGRPLDLAESQGFAWDGGLWTSACAHTGGMVAAAHAALERGCAGSLSSGQHHARRDTGEGFCTFNGIALAARELAGAGKRVLIIDTDAHCAGGTHSLVDDDARISQMDIAVSAFDDYAPAPRNTLDVIRSSRAYLPTLRARLAERAERAAPPDLCIYYAGMDPFEDCSTGGLGGIDERMLATRERIVFDWCRERGVPVAFGLGGGYTGRRLTEDLLVGLHRLTLQAASGTFFAAPDGAG
jgi:acetoin utilization deacetylase AcuC-like enzyme